LKDNLLRPLCQDIVGLCWCWRCWINEI